MLWRWWRYFCNDETLAAKIKSWLNHGQGKRYEHKYIGINGRLDTLQAAILNVKLKHFNTEAKKRIEIGNRYSELLKGFPGCHTSNYA